MFASYLQWRVHNQPEQQVPKYDNDIYPNNKHFYNYIVDLVSEKLDKPYTAKKQQKVRNISFAFQNFGIDGIVRQRNPKNPSFLFLFIF